MTGIKSKMMLAVCNNIALLFKKIKGYNIKHINKRYNCVLCGLAFFENGGKAVYCVKSFDDQQN